MIVYLGNFQFPMGDAVAKRALGLGICLEKSGYSVAYIGTSSDVDRGMISEEQKYGSFRYCSISSNCTNVQRFFNKQDLKCIKEKLGEWNEKFGIESLVFCGTRNSFFAEAVVNYCRKHGIHTVADSMDWLSYRTRNILFNIIKQMDVNREIKRINCRADSIISISTYLHEYYRTRGKRSFVIPPISPLTRKTAFQSENQLPKLIYAGIPCRLGAPLKRKDDAKDRLDLSIRMINGLKNKGVKCEFDIFGITQEQAVVVYPELSDTIRRLSEDAAIVFKGYCSSEVVQKAIEEASFSILIRNKTRSNMAGFPTKLAESIVLGTPVITTDVGDVSRYLTDGKECIIVNPEDLDYSINKIAAILSDNGRINEMKKEAYNNHSFSPDHYVEKVEEAVIIR